MGMGYKGVDCTTLLAPGGVILIHHDSLQVTWLPESFEWRVTCYCSGCYLDHSFEKDKVWWRLRQLDSGNHFPFFLDIYSQCTIRSPHIPCAVPFSLHQLTPPFFAGCSCCTVKSTFCIHSHSPPPLAGILHIHGRRSLPLVSPSHCTNSPPPFLLAFYTFMVAVRLPFALVKLIFYTYWSSLTAFPSCCTQLTSFLPAADLCYISLVVPAHAFNPLNCDNTFFCI